MAVYYGKIRLLVPSVADGKNATITSERGTSRTVEMSAPITDVMLAGMEKYIVQAGTGQSSASIGFGEMQKIVTEDASAITVASTPTKTSYLVGENLDLTGVAINATIQKGDGTSETRDVTSLCDFDPANGVQLNTAGTQQIDVDWLDLSSYFSVEVVDFILKKMPVRPASASFVVFNNEIHLIGGSTSSSTAKNHYKFSNSTMSWVKLNDLPANVSGATALVYSNKLYLINTSSTTFQGYKYNETNDSWSSFSGPSRTYAQTKSQSIVFSDKIYSFFSYNSGGEAGAFYSYNGSSWSNVGATPVSSFDYARVTVFQNQLHFICYYNFNSSDYFKHYIWNGTSWTQCSVALPYSATQGDFEIVTYQNKIHLFRYFNNEHYSFDGTSWTKESDTPIQMALNVIGAALNFGDNIILSSDTKQSGTYANAMWDGTSWTMGV